MALVRARSTAGPRPVNGCLTRSLEARAVSRGAQVSGGRRYLLKEARQVQYYENNAAVHVTAAPVCYFVPKQVVEEQERSISEVKL